MTDDQPKPKSKRGFASLSKEHQLECARAGGRAVKPANRSFARNPELARSAGRTGGLVSPRGKA